MSSADLEITRIKLGNNLDQTKNFFISVPDTADGTLTITRCSGGTPVATIDAAGKVTFPGNAQTLQQFTAATRVPGTVYLNETPFPITVMLSMGSNIAVDLVVITLNDGTDKTFYGAGVSTAGHQSSATFVVPPFVSYKARMESGTSTFGTWLELR